MASTTTAAQAELISSLAQDEIPIKLRCAICSRLAVNAFRLPCCDQAICETCQSTLPSSCPVCEHTPVAAEDCKPNKSLRTTIKVFLRTEEKKREALRLKEAKNTPPDTPRDVEPPAGEAISDEAPVVEEVLRTPEVQGESVITSVEPVEEAPANLPNVEQTQEAQQDIPQPSIEEIAPGQEQTDTNTDANAVEDATMDTKGGSKDLVQKDADGQTDAQGMAGFGAGFGFDPSATGSFPNMAFGGNGDFNQMQMMMAMQNGMAPNAFGNFPMMGMPGMNMDPMTMQNMFMNGGFGAAGMGMNGMNMGMGIGGFDGGVNGGFNNGWMQQQSWNVGPDNFNHPNAAAGMGHGDYGANNSGYPQHAAGYNQGNYGHGNQYNNSFGNQGYQTRGRGRGRGGFNQGRGGYGYGQNDAHSQQFPQQFGQGQGQLSNGPISETGSVPTGPKADSTPVGNVDEFGREIRPSSETKDEKSMDPASAKEGDVTTAESTNITESGAGNEVSRGPQQEGTSQAEAGDMYPKPIQTLDEAQAATLNVQNGPNGFHPMSPLDPNVRGFNSARGGFNHNYHGRGGSFSMQPPPVKAVPINAPTGPKALREGLPNTGWSGLRGRSGFSIVGRAGSGPVTEGSAAPEAENKERDRSKSPSKERDRSRSKERKRDREREERHRRKHRNRSTSRSEDERESERRRERRKERRSRHHEDDEENLDRKGEGTDKVDKVSDDKGSRRNGEGDDDDERSRSTSPAERSSHRSRRDREKDRHRDKDRGSDKDRDHKSSSSHKHRSSHRSHRDDRSRSRDRDRDRDRDREHRHSRRHESRRGSVEVEAKDETLASTEIVAEPQVQMQVQVHSRKPSITSPINGNGIEIKGASSRKAAEEKVEKAATIYIPTGPKTDRVSGSSTRNDRDRERSSRHQEEKEREKEKHRSSRHRDPERSSGREKERDRDRDREKEKPKAPPAGPTATPTPDPHTLEREARNRERILKEAQRLAGLTATVGMGMGGMGGRKRSRDEGDEGANISGRKGRKKGRRSGVIDENEEARLARLEAEREGARWG